MNKTERKELAKIEAWHATMERLPVTDEKGRELLLSMIARSMGTLARAASSHKAYCELTDAAERMNVRWHGEFILKQWEAVES